MASWYLLVYYYSYLTVFKALIPIKERKERRQKEKEKTKRREEEKERKKEGERGTNRKWRNRDGDRENALGEKGQKEGMNHPEEMTLYCPMIIETLFIITNIDIPCVPLQMSGK